MEYVTILRGEIEHGHRDAKAIGPMGTIERASEIRDTAIAAGLEADVLILHEHNNAEQIINTMAEASS